jgi:hypothetical protein
MATKAEEEGRYQIQITLIVEGRSDEIIYCPGKLTVAQAICYIRNKFSLVGGGFSENSKPVCGFNEIAVERLLKVGKLTFEDAQPSSVSGMHTLRIYIFCTNLSRICF